MRLTTAKEKQNIWLIVFVAAILSIGLLLRDVGGVGINKFIFLIVAVIPIFGLATKWFLVFASLLIPMFVGLPGNYISVCLLLRFLYEIFVGKIRCDALAFLSAITITIFLFMQNVIHGHTDVYYMMGAVDFFILLLLISGIIQHNATESASIAYLVGVVIVGAIMLTNTLQHYDLKDLMDSSTRLGDTGMLYEVSSTGMVVTVDPNFYGMNVIAAVSVAANLVLYGKPKKKGKGIIIILGIVAIAFSLIGLSRAFVLVLLGWAILLILGQGDLKKSLAMQLILALLVIFFLSQFPTVIEGILRRFGEGDMTGGNGRINLIIKYYEMWNKNFGTILFGIGLYNCRTHSTPFLYLFALGFVGFIILLLWFGRIIKLTRERGEIKGLKRWIPFLATFVMYSTIPAAGAINYTYPLIIAILALSQKTNGRGEHCEPL